eukprot:3936571-Rhodomonas_salina.2
MVVFAAENLTDLHHGDIDLWLSSEIIASNGERRFKPQKTSENRLPGAKELLKDVVKTEHEGFPEVHFPTKSDRTCTFPIPLYAFYVNPSKLEELGLESTAEAVVELFTLLEYRQQKYGQDMFGLTKRKEIEKAVMLSKEIESISKKDLEEQVKLYKDKSEKLRAEFFRSLRHAAGKVNEAFVQTVMVFADSMVDFFDSKQVWEKDKSVKSKCRQLLAEESGGGDSDDDGFDVGGDTQAYVPPPSLPTVEEEVADDDDEAGAGPSSCIEPYYEVASSEQYAFAAWGDAVPGFSFVPYEDARADGE